MLTAVIIIACIGAAILLWMIAGLPHKDKKKRREHYSEDDWNG